MSQSDFVEAWLAGVGDHQFYTRTYPATFPKAVVLFVHGFAEHIARYQHVHVRYPARGVTVFAFDQRGFGRTALDVEHRSKDSAFSKTNWNAQLQDIEFFANRLAKEYPGVPLFLMGHSMGGGLTLAFFTRNTPPPSPESVKLFTGVIGSSPWITLTQSKPKFLRWTGAKLATFFPNVAIPADPGVEWLTRSEAKREENMKDPLIQRKGTLKALDDMLSGGDKLLSESYRRWPSTLPVLFLHGTADNVTSCKSTEAFYNKIEASDKKLSLYEGGYHELVNEIGDIPDRFTDEVLTWIENHVPKPDTPISKL
ncbi:hypothetical protein EIP86_010204 [Pleurotus ostreatoroseus]|nr:hypothetical protein EIP86_010204 [Pleurotus ostreatoroseus]